MECKTKRSIVAENHDKLTDKGSITIVNKPKVNEKVSVNTGKVIEKVIENRTESELKNELKTELKTELKELNS